MVSQQVKYHSCHELIEVIVPSIYFSVLDADLTGVTVNEDGVDVGIAAGNAIDCWLDAIVGNVIAELT